MATTINGPRGIVVDVSWAIGDNILVLYPPSTPSAQRPKMAVAADASRPRYIFFGSLILCTLVLMNTYG